MKTMKLKLLVLSLAIGFICGKAKAIENAKSSSQLKKQFTGLADNTEMLERIKNMDSEQKIRVVQNRLVDRNLRWELGLNYGFTSGGDSYINTQNLGAIIDFHINPRWSIGARYQKAYNKLSAEAEAQFERAYQQQLIDPASNERFPQIDYILDSQFVTLSFFPIYGKLNLFDNWISQFDLYTQLGYGVINLNSGSSNLYSLGVGSGVWINSHFSTRLEVFYQKYTDLNQTLKRDQNQIQALISLGVLL
ncbi:MAG: outer membrane beta-barrel domain-containing protein [Bdellovibrionaceae bacterium]|nr:outer membrane beta-barrel domain-containing protein [Pseudobdellovibrionaceae bacterium]NUM58156.1 outer membrane beta-barrel domain-containing protein [Pseudobdellovibrionaceae bacterium]